MRTPKRRSLALLVLVVLGVALASAVGLWGPGAAAIEQAAQRWARDELGRDLQIDGGLGLRMLPLVTLVIKEARLANAPGFGERPFAEAERIELRLRPWPLLVGRFEIASARAWRLRLELERDRQGRSNWPEALSAPPPRSAGERRRWSPIALASAAELQAQPADVFLRVEEARIGWTDHAMGLAWLAEDIDLVTTALVSGEPIRWWIEVPRLDTGGPRPLPLEGRGLAMVSAAGDQLAFPELALEVGGTAVSGHLRIEALSRAPAVRFDLELDRLHLDRLPSPAHDARHAATGPSLATEVPPAGVDPSPAGRAVTAERSAGAASAAEVPEAGSLSRELPAGRSELRVDGTLAIADLAVAGLRLGRTDLAMTATGSDVHIEQRAPGFYSGVLDGDLRLDLRDDPLRVALSVRANELAIAPLLADVRGIRWLAGTAGMTLDLTALGSSLPELVASLDGQAAVRVRDAAVRGLDLDGLLTSAQAALEGRPAGPGSSGSRTTAFSEIEASARIRDGILINDDLVGRSDYLTVTGEGQIDLVEQSVDYRLQAVLVDPPEGRGVKELEGIPIPVRVTGRLQDPSWAVDVSELVREAARRRLEDRDEDLLEQLEERLGLPGLEQGLRGLLGR